MGLVIPDVLSESCLFFLITVELTGVSDLHMTLQTEAMILFFRFVRT